MEKQGKYPYYAIEHKQGHISGWYIVQVLAEGLVSTSIDGIRYQDREKAIAAAEKAGITIRKIGSLFGII